ncbi:MAG: hypothetical protein VXZ59_00675 [Cyanobacteriota bacterium]|nr:hypothetical protein [Cyanobacteriota bacterium]
MPDSLNEWFAIKKRVIKDTIADMNVDPVATEEVFESILVETSCA